MTQDRAADGDDAGAGVAPSGEVYDWYQRGLELLSGGNPAAAAQVLVHAAESEPHYRSVREALARAQFDAEMYPEAVQSFGWLVERDPGDDYARFGLGLALSRLRDFEAAVEHLALAAAMRPDLPHYSGALRAARGTLRARRERQ